MITPPAELGALINDIRQLTMYASAERLKEMRSTNDHTDGQAQLYQMLVGELNRLENAA